MCHLKVIQTFFTQSSLQFSGVIGKSIGFKQNITTHIRIAEGRFRQIHSWVEHHRKIYACVARKAIHKKVCKDCLYTLTQFPPRIECLSFPRICEKKLKWKQSQVIDSVSQTHSANDWLICSIHQTLPAEDPSSVKHME